MSDTRPIGVAIIGAGAISAHHALAYRALPHMAHLVAVADVDARRAEIARQRFHATAACVDYRSVLDRDDVQAVSVCTPPASHAAITLDAISAGKHVLCEKPMCTGLLEADAVLRAAAAHPSIRVSFVYQNRQDPALSRARWVLDQGALGRVLLARFVTHASRDPTYYAGVRGRWTTEGGGALLAQGIHLLDALIWLLGAPSAVSAVMDTFVHEIETEDAIVGWARLDGGALATIECTTCSDRDYYTIDVLGEHASLHLRYRPGRARTWHLAVKSPDRQLQRRLRRSGTAAFPSAAYRRIPAVAQLTGAKLQGKDFRPRHLGHTPHVRRFLEAVHLGHEPPVSATEARRSLEVAIGLYESALSGQVVAMPLDPGSRFYGGVSGNPATVSRPVEN